MEQAVIEFEGFSFGYTERPVLEDINFKISEGDYVSIIGPNGSGKSTLLKSLNRIIKGKEGSVKVFGKRLEEYKQKELATIIGYVPQHHTVSFEYSVYEFVLMGRYPYLSPFARLSKEDKEAITKAIEITGLEAFADRPLGRLSGGERQKVYLAAALAQQPKILLLDEPTTHLDPKFQKDIQKTITDVSRKLNMTVLHVTHDLNHILTWSKTILALKSGRIQLSGSAREVMTAEHLKEIFETDFHLLPDPREGHPIIVPEAHR